MHMYFVYFLISLRNKKSYVGMTSKGVHKRLEEHNLGSNVWTRQNGPFKLVYYESFFCKADARHREGFYKSGVGKNIKKILIGNNGE